MNHDSNTKSDTGFTLVELLIYSMLMVLVLAIVGGMIASFTSSSKTVGSITQVSTSGQLAAESVERGIRNASDFRLTNPTGTDQLLIARTAGGGTDLTWQCAAWYYSASDSSLRYTTSATAIPTPTTADFAHWTLLGSGFGPTSGTAIFSSTGPQLTLAFTIHADGHPPQAFTSTAVSRAGSSGTPACY
jgi:Tfp pilus assembly protein PilW